MNQLALTFGFILVLHFFSFKIFTIYRTNKIIFYLNKALHSNQIPLPDYKTLITRYSSGLFKMFESFPSKQDYPELYNDLEFVKFVKIAKILMTYLISAVVLLFVLVLILSE